jgi:hypothetical protein
MRKPKGQGQPRFRSVPSVHFNPAINLKLAFLDRLFPFPGEKPPTDARDRSSISVADVGSAEQIYRPSEYLYTLTLPNN